MDSKWEPDWAVSDMDPPEVVVDFQEADLDLKEEADQAETQVEEDLQQEETETRVQQECRDLA